MEPVEEYLNYKREVIDSLEKEINRLDENHGNLVVDYNYKIKVADDRYREITFDLVELDHEGKILTVYVICSSSAFKRNRYSLIEKMLFAEKTTDAKVFLSFIDDNDKLRILPFSSSSSLELLDEDSKSTIPDSTTKTFLGFYKIINQMCGKVGNDMQFFFRGHPDNKFSAIPSIYRKKGDIEKESLFYHEAIRRNPTEFSDDMSTFDKLVKMQHYDLPTRLLDITTNPLVALYFACQEAKKDDGTEADGAVLVYSILRDSQIKYFDSDSVCILANLAKRPITFDFDKEKDFLVYDIQQDRPKFSGAFLESDAINKVFCVLPKLNNIRIMNQDGAFFIFGMDGTKSQPAKLPDQPSIINIKADAKKDILKELKLLGIDEASLFPETDKIIKQIKKDFRGN